MIEAHIFYSGTVQGIGFRYAVHRFAQELNLVGWVRNLRDGRVEMFVQGPEDSIEELIEKVQGQFDGFIRNKQIDYAEVGENFKDFKIVF